MVAVLGSWSSDAGRARPDARKTLIAQRLHEILDGSRVATARPSIGVATSQLGPRFRAHESSAPSRRWSGCTSAGQRADASADRSHLRRDLIGIAPIIDLGRTPTRARGEGLSARRSFHATRCGAQVVECCHGRQCRIPPSAVSDERGALSPASERARVLAGIARAAPACIPIRRHRVAPTGRIPRRDRDLHARVRGRCGSSYNVRWQAVRP